MPKAKLTTRSLTTTAVTTDNIPKNDGITASEIDSNFLNLRDQAWRIKADDSTLHEVSADTQGRFDGGTITPDANGDITVSNLGGSGGSLGNITGSGDTLSSSGSVINFDDPISISIAGSTGSDIGNIARFNSGGNQIDFNHQGDLTGSFFIYDSRAQQAGIDYPFEVSFSSANTVKIIGMKFPSNDGSANQVLKTDGANTLSWTTISGTGGSGNNTFYDAGNVNQDNGSFTLDQDNGNVQLITGQAASGGNKTINTPSNMAAGDVMRVIIFGGGTAGQDFDLTFHSNFLVAGGGGGTSVNEGKARIFLITYDGTRYYLGETPIGTSGYQ